MEHLTNPWRDYHATLSFMIELQAQAAKFLFYVVLLAIVSTYMSYSSYFISVTHVAPDCQSSTLNIFIYHVQHGMPIPRGLRLFPTAPQKIDCLQDLPVIDTQHEQTIRDHQG